MTVDKAPKRRGATATEVEDKPKEKRSIAFRQQIAVAFGELHFYGLLILRMIAVREGAISLLLVLLMVASAVGVIYSSHLSRQLFSELKVLQKERDQYEREWTQLLLEQSAWSAHSRIEKVASTELRMQVPAMSEVVMISAK